MLVHAGQILNQRYVGGGASWYKRLLLNFGFHLFAGLFVVLYLTGVLRWGFGFYQDMSLNQQYSLLAAALGYILTILLLRMFLRYPGARSLSLILPTVLGVFLFVSTLFLFLRLEYSRGVLLTSFTLIFAWCLAGYVVGSRLVCLRIALVASGDVSYLREISGLDITLLESPSLEGENFDAVVADLHSNSLGPDWQSFLARCTLERIPVYHAKQITEAISGRVRIQHLSENNIGSLLPSPLYENVKRAMDVAALVVTAPLTIPLMALVAMAIKLDDGGPIFFVQKRIGFRGEPFQMIKFRSMIVQSDDSGPAYTKADNDQRITRVGKVIRRLRIDEMPQFWNVLKGQMSLIGPRPESTDLSEWYGNDVPFFLYRHVVRPGISGWAQVNQGYAAEVDGMTRKLEYDFYYIKHFSFWLDVMILLKTFRTLLTGFGAR